MSKRADKKRARRKKKANHGKRPFSGRRTSHRPRGLCASPCSDWRSSAVAPGRPFGRRRIRR